MSTLRPFWPDVRGTGAAEFALVLPVALLFLLGIIDVGRFMWRINEAEKGAQQGVRYAVVTAMVPSGLATANFIGSTACGATALTAGDTICAAALPTVSCTSAACTPGTYGHSATNFTNILGRVQNMAPFVQAANLKVEYTGSGVGYAGDPSIDVAPIVTVKLENLSFSSMSLLGASLTMPTITRSQTLEDGLGTASN